MPCGKPCGILGHLVKRGFLILQRACGIARRIARARKLVILALSGFFQRRALPVQPFDGFARILVQPVFARNIAAKLGDAAFKLGNGLPCPCFLLGQRIAFMREPRKHGTGHGLFLAQRRHAAFGGGPRPACLRGGTLGCACGFCRIGQRRGSRGAFVFRLAPAAIQQQALGGAQFFGDFAIAGGLAGLTGKRFELRFKLLQHIFNPRKVGFRAVQLQLCLMPSLIQAGNARRFLQHAAAGLRFGVDQFRDLPLAHQRGAVRAGRGIGKQHLHIARAHLFAIGLIGRSGIAGNAAHHIQLVLCVEACRRQPLAVVNGQRHFGIVARRAGGGTGENHILHAAATHGGGPVLAHDPAQRLQQVRLAATIWPDHACQPRRDGQFGRVDKTFEPQKAQFGELHGQT